MKIVALDGKPMEPVRDRWTPIESLGELTVFEQTDPADIVSRIGDAEIALTNKVRLGENEFSQLPSLKFVGQTATGYDNIDLESARRHNVVVSNVPVYSTQSVAQHVFAMLLSMIHRPGDHDQAIRDGQWATEAQFTFWLSPLNELVGKSLGIVGFGRIGQATARVGQAFGMKILVSSRTRKEVVGLEHVQWCSPEEVFQQADVVSLHCPQTEANCGFVNSSLLSRMKSTSILINTARGALINVQDLTDALNQGTIAGACLDVLAQEPVAADNPLLTAKNCLITPHIAWTTVEARARLLQITADNIAAFQSGSPINIIT